MREGKLSEAIGNAAADEQASETVTKMPWSHPTYQRISVGESELGLAVGADLYILGTAS
jgi:hypothetical protein